MGNVDDEIPDDDSEIEFIDLDSSTHNRTSHEFHFSPRVRLWMVVVTTISIVLFLSFTFGSQLYSLVYKPQPPKLATTNPSPISLQTVVDGIVYAINPDNMVYAIRASNGSLIRQSFYADAAWSTSSNGISYTVTGAGAVNAVRIKNNSLLWEYHVPLPVTWSLTLADNRIYIITQGKTDNIIYALSAVNGSLLWRYQLHGYASQAVVAAGGFVYISSNSGVLDTLRASDGSLLWHYQLDPSAQLVATPEDIIYTGGNSMQALHANNGSLAWRLHLSSAPVQPVVIAYGHIYVATFDGSVDAFQVSNGVLLWHHHFPSLAYEPIVISDTIVYIHATDYTLYTLNAITGSQLWSKPVINVLLFAVIDGTAYIVTMDNKVKALHSSGSIFWQRQLPSTALRPLIVSGGVIYTGTSSGTIYAVRARDSALLWQYATQAP